MRLVLMFSFLLPVYLFSQSMVTEMYFTDSFCLQIESDGKDSTWTYYKFKAINKDSVLMTEFLKYSFPNKLKIGESSEIYKLAIVDIEIKTIIAENDFYKNRFGLLTSRLLTLLIIDADENLVNSIAPRIQARHLYNGIKSLLSEIPNENLIFLLEQSSYLDFDKDYYSLAVKYFNLREYEKSLYFSKLFLLVNNSPDERDSEAAIIFELSNVAFELQNKFAVLNTNNQILSNILSNSCKEFPKTKRLSADW